MVKTYYSWQDVNTAATNIALKMYKDGWKPDYIVGLNRGGLPISVMLSHLLNCNHYALDVRLRDSNDGPESNCWMAEDAFGYEHHKILEHNADISASAGEPIVNLPISKKNILIVDDINDTGATFKWIREDWESGCLPGTTDGMTYGIKTYDLLPCVKRHIQNLTVLIIIGKKLTLAKKILGLCFLGNTTNDS